MKYAMILIVLIGDLLISAWPTFRDRGFGFITSGLSLNPETAGVWTAIIGSLIIAVLVVVLAYLNFATNFVSLPKMLALMLAFAIGPVAIVGSYPVQVVALEDLDQLGARPAPMVAEEALGPGGVAVLGSVV